MAAKRKRKSSVQKSAGVGTEIFGIVFFGVSILLCLCVLFEGFIGAAGLVARSFVFGLFGRFIGTIVPILLVISSILVLFKKGRELLNRKGPLIGILIWMVCSLFSAATFQKLFFKKDFFKNVISMFKNTDGGGVLGNLLAWPLIAFFNVAGTIIVLSILTAIVFVLLTRLSVLELVKKFFSFMGRLFIGLWASANERKKNATTREKKAAEKRPIADKKREEEMEPRIVIQKPMSFDYESVEPEEPEIQMSGIGFEKPKEELPLSPLEEEEIKQTLEISKNAKPVFNYKKPDLTLLSMPTGNPLDIEREKRNIKNDSKKLESTLKSFGVEARVINVTRGPAVTRYELSPAPGVKVSKIVNLADDIALNLASQGVRIEAPIPGKAAVGIEVPNSDMDAVFLGELLQSKEFNTFNSKLAFAVGKGLSGEPIVADISKMPHLLIAGATGAGKSVCINSLIVSLLYKASPDEVKLLMIDPKVVELGIYNGIPHLLIPVVTDPRKAAGALNWGVQEMTQRYKLFAENGVRDINGYNKMIEQMGEGDKLPQIVIIIDELADLMMVASNEVEDSIIRLAQMARAAGMHLVIATQRPSVDVITGIIKANIPSRLSFAVTSQVDSRTILDMGGAEKLLGKGDMLFHPVGASKPVRIKGCFVSDTEVESIVEFVKSQGEAVYDESIISNVNAGEAHSGKSDDESDELLPRAIELVVAGGQASVSMLQRKFKLGYARAARIIDQMEERGIVGSYEGSKPRQVLISKLQWQEMCMAAQSEKDD